MKHSNFLTIFIFTRDRPTYLKQLLEYVRLTQRNVNFEIIVSDNSTSLNSRHDNYLLSNQYSFKYIQHKNISFENHFYQNLMACNSPWVMFLHDDDLINIAWLSYAFNESLDRGGMILNCGAIGFNSYTLDSDSGIPDIPNPNKGLFSNLKESRFILNRSEFVKSYFSNKVEYMPFPFYIYNVEAIKLHRFNFTYFGKYADVDFLSRISESSGVYWDNTPVGYYRFHHGQDSAAYSFIHHFRLMKQCSNHISSVAFFIFHQFKRLLLWILPK